MKDLNLLVQSTLTAIAQKLAFEEEAAWFASGYTNDSLYFPWMPEISLM